MSSPGRPITIKPIFLNIFQQWFSGSELRSAKNCYYGNFHFKPLSSLTDRIDLHITQSQEFHGECRVYWHHICNWVLANLLSGKSGNSLWIDQAVLTPRSNNWRGA
jgi:hypothetical protein